MVSNKEKSKDISVIKKKKQTGQSESSDQLNKLIFKYIFTHTFKS